MEKKGNIVLIVVLSLLVIALGGYIVYDKVLSHKYNNPSLGTQETSNSSNVSNNDTQNTTYQKYTKGNKITLKDKSEWLVLADSSETEDIVKLMNIKDFIFYGSPCSEQKEYIYCDDEIHDGLLNEYFNVNTTYKGSKIEKIINSYESKIPVTLKEVDGYKIRLLSINDIFEFDNNWKKIDENEYEYTGSKLEEAFLGAWTKDTVGNKCYGQVDENGRCNGNTGVFFTVRSQINYETGEIEGTYLTGGASGLSNIKPVIYAYKKSI